MLFSILFSIFIFCIFITLEINLRFFRLKKTVSPIKIVSFSLTVFFFSILFSQFFFNYNFERYLVAFIYFMLFLILYLHAESSYEKYIFSILTQLFVIQVHDTNTKNESKL